MALAGNAWVRPESFARARGAVRALAGKPAGEPEPWLRLGMPGRGDLVLTRRGSGASQGAWPEGWLLNRRRGQSGGWRAGGGAGVITREGGACSSFCLGSWGRGKRVGWERPERGQINDASLWAGPESSSRQGAGPWCSGSGRGWGFSLEIRGWSGKFCPRRGGENIHCGGRVWPKKSRQWVPGLFWESLRGGSGTFLGTVGPGLGHPEGGMREGRGSL